MGGVPYQTLSAFAAIGYTRDAYLLWYWHCSSSILFQFSFRGALNSTAGVILA